MELLEREDQRRALVDGLREAAAGRGRVALVRGETGIGKTALVRSFLQDDCGGARVLATGCDDLATARPLGPFRDLAPDVDGDLAQLLREGSVDDLYEPFLAELRGPPRPTVLVIEDVHWADDATLDLLTFLVRRLTDVPTLLVLSFRSTIEATHPLRHVLGRIAPGRAVQVPLVPLSRAAVAAVAGTDDADGLWRRTGGNPFLLTALVRDHGGGIPASVQDSVLARVAALDPAEQDLVELVSVVPSRVETMVLDACRPGWEDHGGGPEHQGLLEVRQGAVGFRHELARLALVDSLPTSRRRSLHRDLLAALPSLGVDPSRLVHHAIGADDVKTLLSVGPAAARAAERAGAHRQALEHYQRLVVHEATLPVEERAVLWDGYGSELMTAHRLAEARAAWAQAQELYAAAGDVVGEARALVFRAGLAYVMHEPEEEQHLMDRGMSLFESVDPTPEFAKALAQSAGSRMTRWRFDDAIAEAERAIELATTLDAVVPEAYGRIILGTSLVTRGDVATGLRELERGIALAEAANAHNLVVLGHANAAESLLDVARPHEAADHLERGIELAGKRQTTSVGGYLAAVRARLQADRGDYDSALSTARQAWDGGPMVGLNEVAAAKQVVRVLLRRGEDAGGLLDELLHVCRARGEVQHLGPVVAMVAERALLAGGPPPGDLLRTTYDEVASTGQPWLTGALAGWLHRLGQPVAVPDWVARPHRDAIEGRVDEAVTAWLERGRPWDAALAAAEHDDAEVVLDAVGRADLLGATPLATFLRARLRELGVRTIPRGPQASTREHPAGLTSRQAEVLVHVAAGRTNAEIADLLVLSVRTVDHHVSAILAKLGVATRQDAAEAALDMGILPAQSDDAAPGGNDTRPSLSRNR